MLRGSTKWTLEKFLSCVTAMPSGCIEWNGCRDAGGYGQTKYKGTAIRTHRLSWILNVGPIPVGSDICHRCDNPPCGRIDHLFVGAAADNMQDMRDKGRHGTAKLSAANIPGIFAELARGDSQAAVGARHGVSQSVISDIKLGRLWVAVKAPRKKAHLDASSVAEIRWRYDRRDPIMDIARDFAITRYQVANIGKRKQWKNVP